MPGLRDAVDQLKRLGRPFFNWAGKAERLSFDVSDPSALRTRAPVDDGDRRNLEGPYEGTPWFPGGPRPPLSGDRASAGHARPISRVAPASLRPQEIQDVLLVGCR